MTDNIKPAVAQHHGGFTLLLQSSKCLNDGIDLLTTVGEAAHENAKAFHDKCENFSFRASNETAVLITAFIHYMGIT